MQTVEDFQKAIEATFDNESAAQACFELARQMALDFGAWLEKNQYSDLIERKEAFDIWVKIQNHK